MVTSNNEYKVYLPLRCKIKYFLSIQGSRVSLSSCGDPTRYVLTGRNVYPVTPRQGTSSGDIRRSGTAYSFEGPVAYTGGVSPSIGVPHRSCPAHLGPRRGSQYQSHPRVSSNPFSVLGHVFRSDPVRLVLLKFPSQHEVR